MRFLPQSICVSSFTVTAENIWETCLEYLRQTKVKENLKMIRTFEKGNQVAKFCKTVWHSSSEKKAFPSFLWLFSLCDLSFLSKDWTQVLAMKMWSPNHWTARIPDSTILAALIPTFVKWDDTFPGCFRGLLKSNEVTCENALIIYCDRIKMKVLKFLPRFR